jgi:hypothetical protein
VANILGEKSRRSSHQGRLGLSVWNGCPRTMGADQLGGSQPFPLVQSVRKQVGRTGNRGLSRGGAERESATPNGQWSDTEARSGVAGVACDVERLDVLDRSPRRRDEADALAEQCSSTEKLTTSTIEKLTTRSSRSTESWMRSRNRTGAVRRLLTAARIGAVGLDLSALVGLVVVFVVMQALTRTWVAAWRLGE